MASKLNNPQSVVVRFPGTLAERLKNHSDETLIPVAALVRSLVQRYLDEVEEVSYPKFNPRHKIVGKTGIHFAISQELQENVRSHAQKHGTNEAEVIRSAVNYYLSK